MSLTSRGLAVLLVFFAATVAHAQTPLPEDNLDKLDFHLGKIRKEYAMSRFWGGSTAVVLGSVIGVGGPVIASVTRSQINNDNVTNAITYASIGTGAVLAAGGLATLLWKTEYETIPEAYADMPRDTGDQIRRRILYGETGLQSLADKARLARYFGAGSLAVTGLALMATSAGSANGQNLLYQGMIDIGMGVLAFVIKTSPEIEHDSYVNWKASQR